MGRLIFRLWYSKRVIFELVLDLTLISLLPVLRHDGPEEDDGEAGGAQDAPGVEENDPGGDGRQQQQHHQLQGLCQDDAGQAFSRSQTVSKRLYAFCFLR